MKKVSPFNLRNQLSARTKSMLLASLLFLIATTLTSSIFIGIALAILAGVATYQFFKHRLVQRKAQLNEIWPEVIDHLIAGLYSGLSISEAMSGLAIRGPEVIRNEFADFNKQLRSGVEFNVALNVLRDSFSHHGSDQIFEALTLSKTLGGGEILNTLRTLGNFQREDLMLNKEIAIKHGWIRNSAHIAAAAPWILLLMIGTQRGTADAFATTSGIMILVAGVVMTFIAYIWMAKISKLPETPRVFGS